MRLGLRRNPAERPRKFWIRCSAARETTQLFLRGPEGRQEIAPAVRPGYLESPKSPSEVRRTGTDFSSNATMSTYIYNLVHFVWGTANREPLIRKSWRDRLH